MARSKPISGLVYHPFERLHVGSPVERIAYVKERCRGRRVLDLGAYDETEIVKTQPSGWKWLHAEIASVASEVLGVDASPKLPPEGITTPAGTRIVSGSVDDLSKIVKEFRPDLIVAGELIEHTPNTLTWLSRLATDAPGVDFIATTPNATSMVNIALALFKRESNHQDHLHVYSYKTLATMALRVPIQNPVITACYYNPNLSFVSGFSIIVVKMLNALVIKPIMYVFPLLSSGLILEGKLGNVSSQ